MHSAHASVMLKDGFELSAKEKEKVEEKLLFFFVLRLSKTTVNFVQKYYAYTLHLLEIRKKKIEFFFFI